MPSEGLVKSKIMGNLLITYKQGEKDYIYSLGKGQVNDLYSPHKIFLSPCVRSSYRFIEYRMNDILVNLTLNIFIKLVTENFMHFLKHSVLRFS